MAAFLAAATVAAIEELTVAAQTEERRSMPILNMRTSLSGPKPPTSERYAAK
jgi:hypothetical protein